MPVILNRAMLATLVLLAACASPRYQTAYRYEPPADPAAAPCLEQCALAQRDCQSRCSEAHQACLKTIEPGVESAYAEALKRYAGDLDRYRSDLDRYRFNLWLGWGHGYWGYDPWPPYYMSMITATPPSREVIRNQLAREKCDADCGCLGRHDACFIGCGGSKVEETRCIANCPPQ
ncbi:MAG: hypothetical protein PHR30_04325 [Gallionellaceae bacterium]|nr:hypothetical protein [Gallionellaceae bacterium]MDD5364543.1 hypothetical protein [Gallionellaceae bacterium]